MIDLLGDYDIAVMEVDGFPHPLSAVYRRDTLPQVEALLAQDRLRPVFLFDAVRTRRVQPAEMTAVDPALATLRNLNTREDYLEALSSAGLARETKPRRTPLSRSFGGTTRGSRPSQSPTCPRGSACTIFPVAVVRHGDPERPRCLAYRPQKRRDIG